MYFYSIISTPPTLLTSLMPAQEPTVISGLQAPMLSTPLLPAPNPSVVPENMANTSMAKGRTTSRTGKGGSRGSWKPPAVISPKCASSYSFLHLFNQFCRWECTRDWKENNPAGTQKEFNDYWANIEQDRKKVQVCFVFIPLVPVSHTSSFIRSIRAKSRCAAYTSPLRIYSLIL